MTTHANGFCSECGKTAPLLPLGKNRALICKSCFELALMDNPNEAADNAVDFLDFLQDVCPDCGQIHVTEEVVNRRIDRAIAAIDSQQTETACCICNKTNICRAYGKDGAPMCQSCLESHGRIDEAILRIATEVITKLMPQGRNIRVSGVSISSSTTKEEAAEKVAALDVPANVKEIISKAAIEAVGKFSFENFAASLYQDKTIN